MLLGERRRLTLQVTIRDSDAFTIRDAAWLLEGGGTSETVRPRSWSTTCG